MTAMIEVENLSFRFDSRAVLRDLSFSIPPGESVALLGANGAGKSTLLWCLLGLLHGQGSVRLFGEKPARTNLARVGVVFQNPEDQLFMPTLLDDLTLALLNRGIARQLAEQRALAALAQAGLEEHAREPATHLSLGQRKRAAIALALVGEPELLVLDEPTAELDPRAVRELTALLLRLPGARLIATHHLEFARQVATRVLVLAEGRLIADGPAESVLAEAALLTEAGLI